MTVKRVDLTSVDAVKTAFEGQDAVVSTVGTPGVPSQHVLVEAAVATNVKRFLPSDFGCDIANPKVKELPTYQIKAKLHDDLRAAAAAKPDFTYSLICCNPFLDFGIANDFVLKWKDGKPVLWDGGTNVFSATTLPSVGQAVVGVLTHPEETKNRFVYVKDIDLTQLQLLDLAKKVSPDKTFDEPIMEDTAAKVKKADESIANGTATRDEKIAYIFRVIFGPAEYGGLFHKTDNELLGIKPKTLADVEEMFRSAV